MGMRINTNVASLNAQRNLRKTGLEVNHSLEKLSSGYRINRAGDDAAGLAISENLKAQIRGLKQATRNAEDGISLVQIAEGGLNEISNILIRLRELAVQAASDTVDDIERKFLDVEYENLLSEVERIAQATTYGHTTLLNGSNAVFDIQIGVNNNAMIDRLTFDASKANATPTALGIAATGVDTDSEQSDKPGKIRSQESLAAIDKAIVQVNAIRADFGAIQNRLQSTINNQLISIENLSTANSRVRDVDVAEETAQLAKNNILAQAGTSVLAQANQATAMALQLLKA